MRTFVEKSPDLTTLLEEWTRLYALSDALFFLSPSWISTWIGEAPADIDLACVRVFDDLRGVYGIALAGVPKRRSMAALSSVRLHETGVGAIDRIYLEYNDILLMRDAPEDAREAAITALIEAFPKADEFVFRNARPALVRALETVGDALGLRSDRRNSLRTFQTPLGDAPVFENFSTSLGAKIRRSIRRYEERGPVVIERAGDAAERSIVWTELMRLHALTWSQRGKRGAFNEPAFAGFHERLSEKFPAAVDLLRLIVGRETVGVLYNFIAGDRVYNYQSGFLYEADNQLAPGFVSHAMAAEKYRNEGYAVYDMMGGDTGYKSRLGVEGETLETIVMSRSTLRTGAREFLRRFRPARASETRRT